MNRTKRQSTCHQRTRPTHAIRAPQRCPVCHWATGCQPQRDISQSRTIQTDVMFDKSTQLLLQPYTLNSRVSDAASGPASPELEAFSPPHDSIVLWNVPLFGWVKLNHQRLRQCGEILLHPCIRTCVGSCAYFWNPLPKWQSICVRFSGGGGCVGAFKSNRKNITVQQFNLRSSLTPLRIL